MNKLKGFSLAEILITLIILGFVGALGVPMIGQQKLKKPVTPDNKHGTVECYYGDDGRVHMFTSDNSENKKGTDTVVDGYSCEVNAPTANAFIIQAIGAGGDSGVGLKPTYQSIPINDDGSISTGAAFSTDIAKAPSWVRDNWGKADTSVSYTITSPTGHDGSSATEKFISNNESCINGCTFLDPATCSSSCFYHVTASGGSAGPGGRYKVSWHLSVGDKVSISASQSSVTLSINGKSITLTSSGSGTNGYFQNDKIKNSRYAVNGSDGGPFGVSNSGFDDAVFLGSFSGGGGSSGSVSTSPSSISYRGAIPGVRATYCESANAGSFQSKIYEKLPASKFKLTPAGKTAGSPKDTIVQMDDGSGAGMVTVMEAKSGDDITALNSGEFTMTQSDLPFPLALYPAEFKSHIPEISIAPKGYNSKLINLIKQGMHPGASGRGAYPVISSFGGVFDVFIGNMSTPVGKINIKPIQGKNVKCLETNTAPVDGACVGLKGTPGAVVISW